MQSHIHHQFNFDKYYGPYKNFFKHLGPVRETLLQAQSLKKEAGNVYIKSSRVKLDRYKKQLKLVIPVFSKAIKVTTPLITNALRKLDHQNMYPYCKKLHKRLPHQWKKIKTGEDLHKYRKRLKQLLYCSHLLNTKEKKKILSSKEHKHIDDLQDLIGTWHDNSLLVTQIEKEGLKVSDKFLHSLRQEIKSMIEKINRKGNKL